MKKVDEGVALFDEIWEKVYNAEQQNQKEKHEMDLKKEIKKLQRLRDQIKTWIGNSDIKDKDNLIDARKLIETKMEQFKICEKETKTKTYSKEGLARAEKLDPAEIAKQKTTEWIGEYIEQLNQLLEDREVEIERLSSGKGKKTNKHILEEYNQYCTMHKFHINKLEGIMRLVNNDVLDVEVVEQIKEDLDYYMESYEDDDYLQAYDEDYFYDALGLDELDVVNVDRVTRIPSSGKDKKSTDEVSTTSSKSKKSKAKSSTMSSVIPLTIGRARVSSAGEKEKEIKTPAKATRSATTGSQPANVVPTPAARPPPAVATGGASMAAILKRESEQQEKERQQKQAQVRRLIVWWLCVILFFFTLLCIGNSHFLSVASRTAGSATSRTAAPTTVAAPTAKGGTASSTRGASPATSGTRSRPPTSTAATAASRTAGTKAASCATRGCRSTTKAASSATSGTATGSCSTTIIADASFGRLAKWCSRHYRIGVGRSLTWWFHGTSRGWKLAIALGSCITPATAADTGIQLRGYFSQPLDAERVVCHHADSFRHGTSTSVHASQSLPNASLVSVDAVARV